MGDVLFAFTGMVQSLKAATDIGKALIGIRDATIVHEKVVELNGEILSAQSSALAAQADQFALLEHIRSLEKQVGELEGWEAEKQKYKLIEVRPGAFAYAPKEPAETPEPPHLICAQCYEGRHKSFLQKQLIQPGRCDVLMCLRCGADIYLTGHPYPQHSELPHKKRRPK